MGTLFHVASSLLLNISVQSSPKTLPSGTPSSRTKLPSNGLSSRQLRAATQSIESDLSLRHSPSYLTQPPPKQPPNCTYLSSHLFLDCRAWLIPPWVIKIISASPSWVVPPVSNEAVRPLSFLFFQQEPWIIPPWICYNPDVAYC